MSHRYCGRDFHAEDIALIRRLIAEDPARTRAELSRLTCRALHWAQARRRIEGHVRSGGHAAYARRRAHQLRYTVYSAGQPIALLGFGAAAWMSAPRDHYIGWSDEQRRRLLHLIVNNARFLILPWIQVHNLASMLLAKATKLLPQHWQDFYAYRPVLLETFVERPRFRGTCYHAANWLRLGQTKGRGKLGPAGKPSLPIKDLWVYLLDRRFRETLTR